jgi:hypothetical protein
MGCEGSKASDARPPLPLQLPAATLLQQNGDLSPKTYANFNDFTTHDSSRQDKELAASGKEVATEFEEAQASEDTKTPSVTESSQSGECTTTDFSEGVEAIVARTSDLPRSLSQLPNCRWLSEDSLMGNPKVEGLEVEGACDAADACLLLGVSFCCAANLRRLKVTNQGKIVDVTRLL